jgi:hypothetical protein
MAKRADILVLVGCALEVGAVLALWLCYLLHHFIAAAVTLLVVSGCFFALGIVALLYASLAMSTSSRSENP